MNNSRFIFTLLLTTAALMSCQDSSVNSYLQIDKEIQQLGSDQSKQLYLEQILIDDQAVRSEEGYKISTQYGRDSKEYMAYVQAQWDQDELNLYKVEKYFELYGYPPSSMGDKATTAPWMIIHHSQGYDNRERNFEIVYEAYLRGCIDDGAISFYLGRMYETKFRERHDMESPYRVEDEINILTKTMGIEDKKLKVEQKLKIQNPNYKL